MLYFALAIKGDKGDRGEQGLPGIPGKSYSPHTIYALFLHLYSLHCFDVSKLLKHLYSFL